MEMDGKWGAQQPKEKGKKKGDEPTFSCRARRSFPPGIPAPSVRARSHCVKRTSINIHIYNKSCSGPRSLPSSTTPA